ncbi:MAG: hypothetical protein AAGJ82_14675, partial [Bacteroidota bacterium]
QKPVKSCVQRFTPSPSKTSRMDDNSLDDLFQRALADEQSFSGEQRQWQLVAARLRKSRKRRALWWYSSAGLALLVGVAIWGIPALVGEQPRGKSLASDITRDTYYESSTEAIPEPCPNTHRLVEVFETPHDEISLVAVAESSVETVSHQAAHLLENTGKLVAVEQLGEQASVTSLPQQTDTTNWKGSTTNTVVLTLPSATSMAMAASVPPELTPLTTYTSSIGRVIMPLVNPQISYVPPKQDRWQWPTQQWRVGLGAEKMIRVLRYTSSNTADTTGWSWYASFFWKPSDRWFVLTRYTQDNVRLLAGLQTDVRGLPAGPSNIPAQDIFFRRVQYRDHRFQLGVAREVMVWKGWGTNIQLGLQFLQQGPVRGQYTYLDSGAFNTVDINGPATEWYLSDLFLGFTHFWKFSEQWSVNFTQVFPIRVAQKGVSRKPTISWQLGGQYDF